MLDVDGCAPTLGDDCVLDVLGALDPADATDDVFGVVLLHDAAADRRVAAGYRFIHFAKRDVVSTESVGIDIDLILQRHASNGGDFGHTRHRVDFGTDVIFLQGPA